MNNSDIVVREATPDDIETLVAFQERLARETEGKALESDRLRKGVEAVFRSQDKGFYLVAQGAGCIVGGLMVTYEWSDWRNASFWWIQSVYVDSPWRQRGVYRAMHEHVHGMARSRDNACGVRLYVDRGNDVAQRAYTALGMNRSHYDMYETDFVL